MTIKFDCLYQRFLRATINNLKIYDDELGQRSAKALVRFHVITMLLEVQLSDLLLHDPLCLTRDYAMNCDPAVCL